MLPGAEIFIIFRPDIQGISTIWHLSAADMIKQTRFYFAPDSASKKNRDLEIHNLDAVFLRDLFRIRKHVN